MEQNNIRIDAADGYAYVYTPYHKDFVGEIKKIGSARWDPAAKAWVVPVS